MSNDAVSSEGMIPLFNALSKGTQILKKLDLSNNTIAYNDSFLKYFCKFLNNNTALE